MSQVDEKRLGQRVQQARQAAGLTQQALCQKAGLSYSTLAKIERVAIKTPSIFTIQSIASALHISLDELVGSPARPPKERGHTKICVRFIYFDVNNCLTRFSYRAYTKISADSDLPADVVETLFWRYNDQVCRGKLTMAEFNETLGKHLHLPKFDWSQYYLEATEATPHMGNLVEWVSQHYGVGLLTNSMPGMLEQMLQRSLVPNVPYDVIIDSSKVHLLKPEKQIYEIAQERAGCAPEEILFADDSRANLMAAEKFGWHVMWFDDSRAEESYVRLKEALQPAA